ncbi:MAG: 2-amino-4-hydroxy-6-hydroxymethyldihydropteridine diphosphokinase [Gemmatimonadota bacterium]
MRISETLYLGLGTNVGDRAANLCAALRGIGAICVVDAVSPVYESDAIGHEDQPRFWNMAARGTTQLRPDDVLDRLQQLERDIGRVPTFRMGPRIIDIDVLLYGRHVIETPSLRVPHAGLPDRPFVLRPLLDIEPRLVHPVSGEFLLDRLAATGGAATLQKVGTAHEVLGDCVDTG